MVNLIDIAVAFALGAAGLLAAWALLNIVARLRTGATPGGNAVLDALTPYIYKAIFAGERAVVWGFDSLEAGIEAADKKAVADSIYDLLPDFVLVGKTPIPISLVKQLVTREAFQNAVKNAYDQANAFLQRNEAYLKSQVDVLKAGAGNGVTAEQVASIMAAAKG